MGEIVLHLHKDTARDLYYLLHGYGEYVAAGAPLPEYSPETHQRLGSVFDDLEHQLGIESMADAMQRAWDERNREQKAD